MGERGRRRGLEPKLISNRIQPSLGIPGRTTDTNKQGTADEKQKVCVQASSAAG